MRNVVNYGTGSLIFVCAKILIPDSRYYYAQITFFYTLILAFLLKIS